MTLVDKIKKLEPVIEVEVSSDEEELNYLPAYYTMGEVDMSHMFREKVIEKGFIITKLHACYWQGWEYDEWSCEAADASGGTYKIHTNHGHLDIVKLGM